ACPTTIEPSLETPYAAAYAYPKSPRSFIPPAAVHRNARYCPLAFDAYPTTTEPVDDTPYAWLELPPNEPGHVTVSAAAVAPPPPLPVAPTREMKVSSQMAMTMNNTALGKIFLIMVHSSVFIEQISHHRHIG